MVNSFLESLHCQNILYFVIYRPLDRNCIRIEIFHRTGFENFDPGRNIVEDNFNRRGRLVTEIVYIVVSDIICDISFLVLDDFIPVIYGIRNLGTRIDHVRNFIFGNSLSGKVIGLIRNDYVLAVDPLTVGNGLDRIDRFHCRLVDNLGNCYIISADRNNFGNFNKIVAYRRISRTRFVNQVVIFLNLNILGRNRIELDSNIKFRFRLMDSISDSYGDLIFFLVDINLIVFLFFDCNIVDQYVGRLCICQSNDRRRIIE